MSTIEKRLPALGLTLPAAKGPVANYLGTKRSGPPRLVEGRFSHRLPVVVGDPFAATVTSGLPPLVSQWPGIQDHQSFCQPQSPGTQRAPATGARTRRPGTHTHPPRGAVAGSPSRSQKPGTQTVRAATA